MKKVLKTKKKMVSTENKRDPMAYIEPKIKFKGRLVGSVGRALDS